ncbi:MAG: hypothetical protein ACLQVD_06085 [Capsulimonadaceae bacterium]
MTFETAQIPNWPGSGKNGKKSDSPLFATRREGRWVDYAFYASDLVAEVITGLAAAVKNLSDRRLLVAVSYGYTLEFASRNESGHLSLSKVLASPDIDIVAGPNSYTGRGAGNPGAFSQPIDSITLNKKLWLLEDDTKTHLADSETPDTYNPRIVSPADTYAIHLRHFASAWCHRGGIAWMDLWGQGWLNREEIWRALGELRRLADRSARTIPPRKRTQDVVVLIDESSMCYVKNDSALGANVIGKTREILMRTGASVGFYLQSDVLNDDFPDAPLYLFLNAFRITSAERQAIRDRLHRHGKTLVWLYAPGLFDEHGPCSQESSEAVGMTLRLQPWNTQIGSQLTEIRHPITDRVRGGKRLGQEEVVNPSYSVSDPQAVVLGEYVSTGAPSIALREHSGGWRSVFIGDPHLTVELLRGLFAYAGVPVYDAQDDVVIASREGALLLHSGYTGQRTVNLTERATVYDATDHRIIAIDTRTFRTFLRARTSRLFLYGTQEQIADVSGLEIPSSIPTAKPPAGDRNAPGSRAETGWDQGQVQGDGPWPAEADEPVMDVRPVIVEVRPVIVEPVARMIPGLDTVEPADDLDEADPSDGPEPPEDSSAQPAPRSRWQRRRAAARARREAERKAKSAAEGSAPADISAILPNLPPRRQSSEGPAEGG